MSGDVQNPAKPHMSGDLPIDAVVVVPLRSKGSCNDCIGDGCGELRCASGCHMEEVVIGIDTWVDMRLHVELFYIEIAGNAGCLLIDSHHQAAHDIVRKKCGDRFAPCLAYRSVPHQRRLLRTARLVEPRLPDNQYAVCVRLRLCDRLTEMKFEVIQHGRWIRHRVADLFSLGSHRTRPSDPPARPVLEMNRPKPPVAEPS